MIYKNESKELPILGSTTLQSSENSGSVPYLYITFFSEKQWNLWMTEERLGEQNRVMIQND